MLFWIVALVLAAIAAGTLVTALWRGGASSASVAEYDLRVYRDQLAEIDRDLARGTLAETEAERARIEVSRRAIEADQALAGASDREAPKAATLAAAAFAGALAVGGTAWLYTRLGAPGYPDLPHAARVAMAEEARATRPSQDDVEEALPAPTPPPGADAAYLTLVDQLRAAVAARPNDATGLELLARHEAAIGNFAAAHAAQARLIDVHGDDATAADYVELARLLINAAGSYVSPEAEAALTESLKRDPRNGAARFYSGLLFAQIDRPDLTFRFWSTLLAEGPEDAPWIPVIRERIAQIAAAAGQNNYEPPPARAAPGPTQEQMQAAGEMAPEAQTEMIRGMVEGLAARLADEGGPAADWARLIRAYGVLGETERLLPIVAEARDAFAADPAALAEIDAAARDAGAAP